MQKRMFKVLAMIPKKGGGTHWLRVGSGFTNKDDSINLYLDVMPKNFELQLRELTEEELRKREPYSADSSNPRQPMQSTPSANAPDAIPF